LTSLQVHNYYIRYKQIRLVNLLAGFSGISDLKTKIMTPKIRSWSLNLK
jgi:hypothetical protein